MKRREARPPLTDEAGEVRELTEEDVSLFRPIQEVDPGMLKAVAEWRRKLNKGGRPKIEAPKEHISFRLAADVVASIKATGRGYNARVEEALRAAFVTDKRKRVAPKRTRRAVKG